MSFPKNLLEHEIDDKVAKALIEYMMEWRDRLNSSLKEDFNVKANAARDEYSRKYAKAVAEKTEKLSALQSEVETMKSEMVEKVTTFLSNAKEELRDVVAEDMALDPDFAKAPRVLHEISKMVTPFIEDGINEKELKSRDKQIDVLEEEISQLKKRIERKDEANEQLKAKVKAYSLVSTLPESDRNYFKKNLSECTSVAEVEEKFAILKEKVREEKDSTIANEVRTPRTKGVIAESSTNEKKTPSPELDRMRKLAGINK